MSYQLDAVKRGGMKNKMTQPIEQQYGAPSISIHLCVPDEQERHLPKRRRAPQYLPPTVPLPRIGEVIYLSSTSAWTVETVVHEWRSPQDLRIEVWISYIGAARQHRQPGFELTQ